MFVWSVASPATRVSSRRAGRRIGKSKALDKIQVLDASDGIGWWRWKWGGTGHVILYVVNWCESRRCCRTPDPYRRGGPGCRGHFSAKINRKNSLASPVPGVGHFSRPGSEASPVQVPSRKGAKRPSEIAASPVKVTSGLQTGGTLPKAHFESETGSPLRLVSGVLVLLNVRCSHRWAYGQSKCKFLQHWLACGKVEAPGRSLPLPDPILNPLPQAHQATHRGGNGVAHGSRRAVYKRR